MLESDSCQRCNEEPDPIPPLKKKTEEDVIETDSSFEQGRPNSQGFGGHHPTQSTSVAYSRAKPGRLSTARNQHVLGGVGQEETPDRHRRCRNCRDVPRISETGARSMRCGRTRRNCGHSLAPRSSRRSPRGAATLRARSAGVQAYPCGGGDSLGEWRDVHLALCHLAQRPIHSCS